MHSPSFNKKESISVVCLFLFFRETEYELQKLEKGFKDVGKGQAKEILELKRKVRCFVEYHRGKCAKRSLFAYSSMLGVVDEFEVLYSHLASRSRNMIT